MKLFLILLSSVFTSCAVQTYYQVYTSTVENGKINSNNILFEDNICKVYYNLWDNGGNTGFHIFNKTEDLIWVDLTRSFFVINGMSYEYFNNRSFSESSQVEKSISSIPRTTYYNSRVSMVGNKYSSGNSSTLIEKPVLAIPPKAKIYISEYHVTNSRYINCELPKFPGKDDIKTINFSKENSPFVFYNYITYHTKSDTQTIENKFYVNAITNYPARDMIIKIDTSICGNTLDFPVKKLKTLSPAMFYFQYSSK
jgi:hypothetical protein